MTFNLLFSLSAVWAMQPEPSSIAEATITSGLHDRFGAQLASGHLNNDGHIDVVVSAPNGSADGNRVYVFFGSPFDPAVQSSYDLTDADVVVQGQIGTETGWAIAVGDVIGNGFDDLIVGAPLANGGHGAAYVFRGPLSASPTPLDASSAATLTISGTTTNEWVGTAFAIGDWDDDDDNELAVGAYGKDRANGAAYVMDILGAAMPPTTTAGATVAFETGGWTGYALANAGDVDHDGIDDLLIGSPGYGLTGQFYSGQVHLVYGGSAFAEPHYDLAELPQDTPGVAAFRGERTGSNLGWSLAPAGDLNNDDHADLLIGAPAVDCSGCVFNYEDQGRGYVVLGAATRYEGASPIADVSDQIYEGVGHPTLDHTGVSVAVAGMAGEKWTKLSSPFNPLQTYGSALLLGSEDDAAWVVPYDAGQRWYSVPDVRCEETPEGLVCHLEPLATPNLRPLRVDLTSATGHRIEGPPQSVFGACVHAPGDLDEDGTPDLLISATGQLYGEDPTGTSQVRMFRGQ